MTKPMLVKRLQQIVDSIPSNVWTANLLKTVARRIDGDTLSVKHSAIGGAVAGNLYIEKHLPKRPCFSRKWYRRRHKKWSLKSIMPFGILLLRETLRSWP